MTEVKNRTNETGPEIKTACKRNQCEDQTAREEKVTYLWGLWGSHMAA